LSKKSRERPRSHQKNPKWGEIAPFLGFQMLRLSGDSLQGRLVPPLALASFHIGDQSSLALAPSMAGPESFSRGARVRFRCRRLFCEGTGPQMRGRRAWHGRPKLRQGTAGRNDAWSLDYQSIADGIMLARHAAALPTTAVAAGCKPWPRAQGRSIWGVLRRRPTTSAAPWPRPQHEEHVPALRVYKQFFAGSWKCCGSLRNLAQGEHHLFGGDPDFGCTAPGTR